MIKNKLYIRTLSTVLSVLTIFSSTYTNCWGSGTGNPSSEVSGLPLADGKGLVEEDGSSSSSSSSTPSDKRQGGSEVVGKKQSLVDTKTLGMASEIHRQYSVSRCKELGKLMVLLYEVATYCDITKYKWDNCDVEAKTNGATIELDKDRKGRIKELVQYVCDNAELFSSVGVSGAFVASISCGVVGPVGSRYNQLRSIFEKYGKEIKKGMWPLFSTDATFDAIMALCVPLHLLPSASKTYTFDLRTLFLLYRVPRRELGGISIRDAALALAAELASILQITNEKNQLPTSDLEAFVLTIGQSGIDLMVNGASGFMNNTLTPAVKQSASDVNETLSGTVDKVQEFISTTFPKFCGIGILSWAAIKVLSVGGRYVGDKLSGSSADNDDRNE